MVRPVLLSPLLLAIIFALTAPGATQAGAIDSYLIICPNAAGSLGSGLPTPPVWGCTGGPISWNASAHWQVELEAASIKLSSWSWDTEQSLNIGSQSTGAGAGKITFNPLSITFTSPAYVPALFLAQASGTAFKTATLISLKGGAPLQATTLKLFAVKTLAESFSLGDAAVSVTASFEYGGLQVQAWIQSPTGAAAAGSVGGWNIVRNVADVGNGGVR